MRRQYLNKNTRDTNYYKSWIVTDNIPRYFTDINGNICKYDYTAENGDVMHYYVNKNNETIYFRFSSDLVGKPKILINTNGDEYSYAFSDDSGDWYRYNNPDGDEEYCLDKGQLRTK